MLGLCSNLGNYTESNDRFSVCCEQIRIVGVDNPGGFCVALGPRMFRNKTDVMYEMFACMLIDCGDRGATMTTRM